MSRTSFLFDEFLILFIYIKKTYLDFTRFVFKWEKEDCCCCWWDSQLAGTLNPCALRHWPRQVVRRTADNAALFCMFSLSAHSPVECRLAGCNCTAAHMKAVRHATPLGQCSAARCCVGVDWAESPTLFDEKNQKSGTVGPNMKNPPTIRVKTFWNWDQGMLGVWICRCRWLYRY